MADKLEKLIHRQPPQSCPLPPSHATKCVKFFFFSFFWVLCKTRRSENVTNECRVCLNFWVSFSGSSLTTNTRTKRRRDGGRRFVAGTFSMWTLTQKFRLEFVARSLGKNRERERWRRVGKLLNCCLPLGGEQAANLAATESPARSRFRALGHTFKLQLHRLHAERKPFFLRARPRKTG